MICFPVQEGRRAQRSAATEATIELPARGHIQAGIHDDHVGIRNRRIHFLEHAKGGVGGDLEEMPEGLLLVGRRVREDLFWYARQYPEQRSVSAEHRLLQSDFDFRP